MLKSTILGLASAIALSTTAFAFDLKSTDVAEGSTLKMEQVANIFG